MPKLDLQYTLYSHASYRIYWRSCLFNSSGCGWKQL